MNPQNVIQIIKTIADSLKNDPNQFTYEVNISVIGGMNNTGIANISGGNVQGTVIGQQSTASVDNNMIASVNKKADDEMNKKITTLSEDLAQLAEKIKKNERQEALTLWGKIQKNWCPSIVANIVTELLISLGYLATAVT
jgi:hypothetical protein